VCATGGVVITVDSEPLVGAEVAPVAPDDARVDPVRDEDPLSSDPWSPEHDTVVRIIAMAATKHTA
jgi:hypothetical protein